MNQWVALFRGINVGGRNILPMKLVVTLLEEAGCVNVRTYIQSGNVVFEHKNPDRDVLTEKIETIISRRCNFRPATMLLRNEELEAALDNNPFPQASSLPKSLHFYFLSGRSNPLNRAELDGLVSTGEEYDLIDNVFYLYAPDGIGRSRLASKVEKLTGVAATARNLRTVLKILSMAAEEERASSL